MNHPLKIELIDLSWILIIIFFLFMIIFFFKLYSLKKLFIPLFQSIIQLFLLSFLLNKIINYQNLNRAILFSIFMIFLAAIQCAWILWRKVSKKKFTTFIHFFFQSWLSIFFAMLLPLGVICFLVFDLMNLEVRFQIRTWLALTGITIHTSMVAIILSGSAFIEKINTGRNKIEAALALGLNLFQAIHWLMKESLEKALSPFLLILVVVGFGGIPGFMAAQIIDGQDVFISLYAQLAVLGGIFTATMTSALLILRFLYKKYYKTFLPEKFNKDKRFKKRKKIKIR